MIIIREIDSLRDGGSIIMKLWMTSSDLSKYNIEFASNGYVNIMVDYSAGSTTPGAWYNGIRHHKPEPKIIDSQEFKNLVINELTKKIEREQFKLNKLINEKEPKTQKI